MGKLLDVFHRLQSLPIDRDQAKWLVSSLNQQKQIDPELALRAATVVQRRPDHENTNESTNWNSRNRYFDSRTRSAN